MKKPHLTYSRGGKGANDLKTTASGEHDTKLTRVDVNHRLDIIQSTNHFVFKPLQSGKYHQTLKTATKRSLGINF